MEKKPSPLANVCNKKHSCKHPAHASKKCKSSTVNKRPHTIAVFKCDIGFGNTLFIRGEGSPYLNWEWGKPLAFDEKTQGWVYKSTSRAPIAFKVLINDQQWSNGDNFMLIPGGRQFFDPQF